MKLDSEFFRLPLKFDVDRLVHEASAFAEAEWRPHLTDYKGNTAIILISRRGEQNDDFLGREVRFFCNGRDVHMAAGEAWIFDSWKMHRVVNPKDQLRIHLRDKWKKNEALVERVLPAVSDVVARIERFAGTAPA